MNGTARRAACASALSIVLTATAATGASAATTYPTPSGSTFDNGSAQGWTEFSKSCGILAGGVNLLCTVESGTEPTIGAGAPPAPPGSLRQDYTPIAGALTPLLAGASVAQRSPSFVVAGYPTVGGATLTYDRRYRNEGLINVMPGTVSQVSLIDESVTPNVAIPLGTGDTLDTQANFGQRTVMVPDGVLVEGRTYYLRITTTYGPLLQALMGKNQALYDNVRLSVDDGSVAPVATTDDATNVTASGATLNGRLDIDGPPVTYRFEYGPTTAYGSSTADRTVTNTGAVPGEPIGGLAPLTLYNFRIVATDANGNQATGANKTFTTLSSVGPQGVAGTNGTNGTSGTTGATGATGQAGTPGARGPSGPAGATGPAGPKGTTGSGVGGTTTIIQNGSNKGLVKIRATNITLVTGGRLRGQLRLPIFCRTRTGRACAGTVKVRTLAKINPATRPPARAKRRVTLTTFEYQLAQGRSGFAFGNLREDKINLMERLKSVAVSISIQVTDAAGNRQIVVSNGRLIARRTA